MFVPASPPLGLRFRLGEDRSVPWRAIVPGPATLFARGRFALFEGLRLLVCERGLRRVWLPAWICRPVPEAVRAAGLAVRAYDVDETLAPRLETITPAPGDGLLVVHYFGLAQPLALLRAYCDAHDMVLVEDGAHALPDLEAGVPMGGAGDIAVFSLRKQLPVPGGGVLVVNPRRLRARPRVPDRVRPDAREAARLALMVLERAAFAAGVNLLDLKNRLPVVDAAESSAAAIRRAYAEAPGPSWLLAPLLRRLDWSGLAAARRRRYGRLAHALRAVPAVRLAVPQPPEGSVPLALPVWAADADGLALALRRRGVEATCWPWGEQPPFRKTAYPGAAAWLAHSVFLPVVAPLDDRALDRLADVVASTAARLGPVPAPHALGAAA